MKLKLLVFIFGSVILFIFQIMFCDSLIKDVARKNLFQNESDWTKSKKIGLVLGTSKFLWGGKVNLYYKYRIDCAVALYKKNRVRIFIVSGDNGSENYNEPDLMKQDLIEAGIPEANIFCDYAGFRTLDSIIRAKEIFGANDLLIISQKFHLERALYLSKRVGVNAIGVIAKDVPKWYNKAGYYREKLARVKAVLDICLEKQPKFLGKQEVNLEVL